MLRLHTDAFKTVSSRPSSLKTKLKEIIKMKKQSVRYLVHSAAIAALYVVLTYISSLFGMANGAVQLRLSEALTILPIFTPAAVPGLFVGCIIANIISGCAIWDIIFGSIATLIAAICSRLIRKKPVLAFIPPVLFNTLIVPPVIYLVYGSDYSLPFVYLGVFVGEVLSCGIFGSILYGAVKKTKLFRME
jgi:uncharacterized membrane protein